MLHGLKTRRADQAYVHNVTLAIASGKCRLVSILGIAQEQTCSLNLYRLNVQISLANVLL